MGFKFLDYGLQIKRHYVQDCLVSETQDDVMDRHGTARLNSSNLVKADSIILDPEGYGRWSSKEMKKIRVQGVRFEVHPDDIKLMVHRFTRTRSPAPGPWPGLDRRSSVAQSAGPALSPAHGRARSFHNR